jgi:hypothetical protein
MTGLPDRRTGIYAFAASLLVAQHHHTVFALRHHDFAPAPRVVRRSTLIKSSMVKAAVLGVGRPISTV